MFLRFFFSDTRMNVSKDIRETKRKLGGKTIRASIFSYRLNVKYTSRLSPPSDHSHLRAFGKCQIPRYRSPDAGIVFYKHNIIVFGSKNGSQRARDERRVRWSCALCADYIGRARPPFRKIDLILLSFFSSFPPTPFTVSCYKLPLIGWEGGNLYPTRTCVF